MAASIALLRVTKCDLKKLALTFSHFAVALAAPLCLVSVPVTAGTFNEKREDREQSISQARPAHRVTLAQADIPSIAQDERTQRNKGDEDARVVGGMPVAPGTFPDTVGITAKLSPELRCTGTLIQPDVVLTAAHCLCADVSGRVYVGDNPRQGGRFVAVKKSAHGLQSCLTSLKEGLDLGLLLLEAPVAGITPRPFANEAVINRARSYRVVGFGAVDFDAKLFPEEKREALVVATSNDCRGSVRGQPDDSVYRCEPGQEIVAGRRGTPDSCRGDSGGPLLLGADGEGKGQAGTDSYRLAGVTSRASSTTGSVCGDGGIYERLTPGARDWISQTIATMR